MRGSCVCGQDLVQFRSAGGSLMHADGSYPCRPDGKKSRAEQTFDERLAEELGVDFAKDAHLARRAVRVEKERRDLEWYRGLVRLVGWNAAFRNVCERRGADVAEMLDRRAHDQWRREMGVVPN